MIRKDGSMQHRRVGIVILNYNNYQDTFACIDSLMNTEKAVDYQIFVVDNNSTDNSTSIINWKYGESVSIIKSTRNLGYAGGNNLGLLAAESACNDYICILNNDTLIIEPFLESCIETLEKDDKIGFVSPVLLEKDGLTVQSAGLNLSFIKGLTSQLYSGIKRCALPEQDIKCDIVCGACIVIRKRDLQYLGLIPEQYFLYYEETEWCFRAKRKGFGCKCITDIAIIHKGGKTTCLCEGLSGYFMTRNRVVFMKRNSSPMILALFCIRLLLVTLYRRAIGDINDLRCLRYFLDGFCNRVDSRYDFAYFGK